MYFDSSFCISHKNLYPIFSTVISSKLATLYELRHVYYYEELLDLYEVILVNNYNEMKCNEIQEQTNKAKGL